MKDDSSESRTLLGELQTDPSFVRALMEGIPAGVLVVDRDCRILDLNQRMLEWIGKPRGDILGETCHEVLFRSGQPCVQAPGACPGAQVFTSASASRGILRSLQAEDGQRKELEIRAYPILDESGGPRFALEILQDVTARILLKRTQEEASLRDPLTGLYSRKAFHLFFERGLNRSHRQARPFSLALIDIDSFKDYNEKQGNEAGDALLQRLANLLLRTTRKDADTVFRLEADRFALTLPEAQGEQAQRVGARIRMAEKQDRFPVTFSIAICHAEAKEDPSALFHRAQEVLYEAKKKGGTRIL
jgi:diguanylate cyclase (GGDEF)-like protein/PAS domain S-box-containing protein